MEKAKRPKVVISLNVKKTTGCGNMYVQLGFVDDKLFEVFATLGKVGGCATCLSESLTRSITTGLRCGVDVKEYIDQLKGARCPTPHPFPKEEAVWSCPDAIASVLEHYGTWSTNEIVQFARDTNFDTNSGSDEAEEQEAIKHMEELKKKREEEGV